MEMIVKPIGVINTPLRQAKGAPIQPREAPNIEATIEVFEQYQEGLKDLEGFERIWLIYWFDRACEPALTVVPFLDDKKRGLFSTRAPARPNPIGMSNVRLLGIEKNVLHVAEVDILDRTPLLDIKPFVPRFDCYPVKRSGWVNGAAFGDQRKVKADDRFYDK